MCASASTYPHIVHWTRLFPFQNKLKNHNYSEVSDQATSGSMESTIPSTNDDELTTEALKYVAGYVAFKVRREHPELGTPTGQTDQEPTVCSRWIQTLSRGGLRQPSLVWFQTVQSLEREFRSYHGTGLRKEPGVIKTLVMTLVNKYSSAPASAVKCFIKTRTFIRMRQLNKKAASTKRFVAKKMKKVVQWLTIH